MNFRKDLQHVAQLFIIKNNLTESAMGCVTVVVSNAIQI